MGTSPDHAPSRETRVPGPDADGLYPHALPDGTPVCLIRHEGRFTALLDRCTHADFSLSSGELLPDGGVQCLWHGAIFDGATGAVKQGPATDAVPTFAVRVDEGMVVIGRQA